MFYIWECVGTYAASLVAADTFVALGAAALPDATVLTVAFDTVGAWNHADTLAGSPWVTYPRATISGLTESVAGAVPADLSDEALPLPKFWGGVLDGLLGRANGGGFLVAVEDATSFTEIPDVEVWHYRPMTDAEIVAALPLADVVAGLPAADLYGAIGGAYSDAINRDVLPAPTAGRPTYLTIVAPSS